MPNQEENIMRFMKSRENARKLIQMDVKGQLDSIRKKAVNEGKISYDENGDVQASEPIIENNVPKQIQQETVKNSKLPPEIIESMMKNKIDTTMINGGIGSNGSILDQLNAMTNGKLMQEVSIKNKESKNESTNNVIQTSSNPNIDYSMIKMIVEDCMKKYYSSLKKSIINESKNSSSNDNFLQAMKIGNKFSFITKNGDLYEANLKFIKNINKK